MKTKRLNLRVEPETDRKLRALAKKYRRSLSNYILFILSGAIEFEERKQGKVSQVRMMELKHTPGPLFVNTARQIAGCNGDIAIVNEKGSLIAVAYAREEETLPNARLIAAAPELLDDKIKDYKEIGPWLSAALEDDKVCGEFKQAIQNWFSRLGTIEKATGLSIDDILK